MNASEVELSVGDEIEVLENGLWEPVVVIELIDDWGFGYRNKTLHCGCRWRDSIQIRLCEDVKER